MSKKNPKINGKVLKTSLGAQSSLVKKPEELHQGLLSFSFKYLDLEHSKFDLPCPSAKAGYLAEFFNRVKAYSTLTAKELQNLTGKAGKCHPLKWEETSEKQGFSQLDQQLQDILPWQISICANRFGRLHGFFIDSTFYVVWLDHDHRLYPSKK